MYPFFEFLGPQSVWGKIFEKKSRAKFTVQLCEKRMKAKFGGRKTYGSKIPPHKNTIFFGHQHLKKKRSKNRFFFTKKIYIPLEQP